MTLAEDVRTARADADAPHAPLWRAETNRGAVTLFGSLHVMPRDTPWGNVSALIRAIIEADAIVFESVDAASWLNGIRAIPAVTGSPQTNVLHLLQEPDRSAFLALADQLGLQERQWRTLKPFMVAAYLRSAYQQQKFGLDSQFGVETLLKAGVAKGKKWLGLEDPLTVTRARSEVPVAEQARDLVETMRTLDAAAQHQLQVTEAWRRSDMVELNRLLSLEANAFKADGLYRSMVLEREQAWAERLRRYADQYRNLVVVVGIGHLVYEDGFLNRCRRVGLSFERLP
jgi:uncharacterized protein YbaP (TraB family)